MTRTITVPLAPAYNVVVGKGLAPTIPERRVAVLFDPNVREHAKNIGVALQAQGKDLLELALPSGEDCKTLTVLGEALSQLARAGFTRDSAVLAVGGGATSDLAGFVAASYLRGVAFYVAPTTLLAMVDAAVGGKTGINLPEGKNLVGAFHQPKGVWADLASLRTLPARVFREGSAELFKHGLIANPALCDAVLQANFDAQHPSIGDTITDGIQVKADIVGRDPTEQHERAFLNYGHTLAHALEAASQHTVAHGEAVGYGMHYAAHLGKVLGLADVTAQTHAFLTYQQPAPLPRYSFEDLSPFMARDKKANDAGLRFVLLQAPAKPVLQRVPTAAQLEAWALFRKDLDM